MKQYQDLYIKNRTGENHWRHKDDFLEVATDQTISPADKQRIYNGEFKTVKEYRAWQGKQEVKAVEKALGTAPKRAALTNDQIKELNPVHVDPRIESLKHLHPEQLNKNKHY